MNKLWLSFLTMLLAVSIFGQTKITGMLKSSTNDKPLYDAEVSLLGTSKQVNTDRIGYFQLLDVSDGIYTLSFSKEGYGMYEQQIEVQGQKSIDLGEITLMYDPQEDSMGVITLTDDELTSDESSSQSSVGLLQSSKDVFAKMAAYELGAYWFRTRGYDNKYSEVFFNGIRMNKIDNNRVDFGNWGGLNDVTRYPSETTYGLDASDNAFGGAGGMTYYDTRPSQLRTGTSLSYSLSNRSYRQRLMLTHNTGLSKKGWGFMLSGSHRWAEEGRIDGTTYDAWAYFLGIEKKFSDKHTLNLTVFGAPYRRSTNSPNTEEVVALKGIGYNAYWGWQDGEKRNERLKTNHEPVFQLTHHWDVSKNTKLTTTASYQFGKNGYTRLDWNNAYSPSPVYYRNMPSWYLSNGDQTGADYYTNLWKTDESFSQINWDALYNANYNQADGHAVYFVANDVNMDKTLSFNSNLRTQINENYTLFAGLSYQNVNSEMFREVDDLLGAQYVLDKDDYAEFGESGDYDENHPDKKVGKDGKVQYDYAINQQKVGAFFAANYKKNKWDITLSLKSGYTGMSRFGKFDHYKYDDSYGRSKTYSFVDWGSKLMLTYKLNGRNFIRLNGAYFSNAPTFSEVFPSARESAVSSPDIDVSKIASGDLSYILRAPKVKARLTGYYTKFMDETQVAFAYIDRTGGSGSTNNVFTAEVLTGVDKQHVGGEFAMEAQLTSTFTLNAVASVGEYTYANNPDVYYFSEDYADQGGYDYIGKSYLKDYKVSSSAQSGYALGFQYRDPHYWWLGATGNYLTNNYISPAASLRTEQFQIDPSTNLPYAGLTQSSLDELLKQQKFSDEFMLNVNAGKTFRFGKYYMGVSLTVNNVLNNKDYITGGFEQLRLANYADYSNADYRTTFGSKTWRNQGTSYFLNVFLRF